jgi:hypothetical protein
MLMTPRSLLAAVQLKHLVKQLQCLLLLLLLLQLPQWLL